MPGPPRITYATALVLQAVARGYCYGFDVMDASGLPDGTVYPVLRRLEAAGMLSADWEDEQAARAEKRPARRYYRLTADGERVLGVARARFHGLTMAIPPGRAQPERA